MNAPTQNKSLIDPQKESVEGLIGVIFSKSRSSNYEVTLAIAKTAKLYGEASIGKTTLHYAIFGRDKMEASKAVAVISAVRDWKNTKLFARGRILERHYNVDAVLKCYLNSLELENHEAHCHFIYDDMADAITFPMHVHGRHLVPCRMIQGFVRDVVRDPVAGPKDSIQAAAVRRGSFWCPHFDPTKFRELAPEERHASEAKKNLLTLSLGKLLGFKK